MANDFQYDVFLSHSSKDKSVVRPLAERLRGNGLRVWLDEWVLKPGDSIPAKVEEGLEHSRVLVLCMSANAFGSDWAQLEAGTFRFRDPLNKERRFIPLRLDDAPIKGSLAQFLYIYWRPAEREQEYAKLLDACLHPATWPLQEETKTNHINKVMKGHHRTRQHEDDDKGESNRMMENLSPFKVLAAALTRVPGLRILFGVVGVLAILAIARVWSLDRGWTIVGGCAVVLLSFVLLVLAKFSASKTSEFRGPARVLMWFCVLLFMAWCALLTGCVFFKWPVPVIMLPLSPVPPQSETFPLTVFVHGEGGKLDMVARNTGFVVIDLDGDRRREAIGDKGQAFFPAVPSQFRNKPLPISVDMPGFKPMGTGSYPLEGNSIYLPVRRLAQSIRGYVQDDAGKKIQNAVVSTAGILANSDATGYFELGIPADRLKPEMSLQVEAAGYSSWRGTAVPGANDAIVILQRLP